MELGSPEALGELMRRCGNPPLVQLSPTPDPLTPERVRLRSTAQGVSGVVSKGKKLRCKCGVCRQCLDEARWERIFAEKFADPHYYDRPITRCRSSLASE